MITTKRMNENNMVTIPQEIRDALGIKPKDLVELDIKKVEKGGD